MTSTSISFEGARIEATNAFFRRVYHWMTAGLILTAVMAHWVASSPTMLRMILGNIIVFYILIGAELLLVFTLSGAIQRISAGAAMAMFVLYSLLNGATLSVILLVYARESIFGAFLTTAGMFAAMSVYGLYTKRDLTSLGSFLRMGLMGLLIAMLVNFFVGSGVAELAISAMGVLIFLGLTAYDTQYLRELGGQVDLEDDMGRKLVIIGALKLYLDFVNIFLFLLRLFGRRR